MIRIRPVLFALALILPGSRLAAQPTGDSTVFTGSIAGGAPLVFMALHPEMTVAYDEKTGVLAQAWKGTVVPAQEMAPANLKPYRATGPSYHLQTRTHVWAVRNAKGPVSATPKFGGVIQVQGDHAVRTFLQLPGGRKITVLENPGFDDHYGDNALRRIFTFSGIPAGHRVELWLSGHGMPENWGGGGAGRVEKTADGKYRLVQTLDGETPLKVTWSGAKTPSYPSSAPVSAP